MVAGNIYTHYTQLGADSVLQLKKDAPGIGLYATDIANVGTTVMFGQKNGGNSPFKDVRVRQAWSMAVDRDLYLETFGNTKKFKDEGIKVETGFNTATAPSDYTGWYIDPMSKEFGENGKYYKYDIAEAKKLMAAAGLSAGTTIHSNQIGTTDYGPLYARQIEVLEGMAGEIGFKFEKKIFWLHHGLEPDDSRLTRLLRGHRLPSYADSGGARRRAVRHVQQVRQLLLRLRRAGPRRQQRHRSVQRRHDM